MLNCDTFAQGRHFTWREGSKSLAAILVLTGGYQALKDSGAVLPSRKTANRHWKDYCERNGIAFGYGKDSIKQNCRTAVKQWKRQLEEYGIKGDEIPELMLYILSAIDETAVAPGLMFDNSSEQIIGLKTNKER